MFDEPMATPDDLKAKAKALLLSHRPDSDTEADWARTVDTLFATVPTPKIVVDAITRARRQVRGIIVP